MRRSQEELTYVKQIRMSVSRGEQRMESVHKNQVCDKSMEDESVVENMKESSAQ